MSPVDASPQRHRGDGGRTVSLAARLPRNGTAPAAARHLVRSRLAHLLAPDTTQDVLLVVSELLTNALLHGAGDIELRLAFDGDLVTGAVTDEGPGFVRGGHIRPASRAGGKGLYLVGRLARRWGVREDSGHVWFEIAAEPAAPPAS